MTAEQAEGNSLAARAAYDAVVQRRQETEKSLADTRAYLEQLKSEAKSPTDENVSLEQIEEQQKELDRVGERLKQLTASMQETAKEVNRHAQSLAAADAQFQDKKKELARLEALMAAEQVEVFRVRTSVGKQERHLANLRKMERLLEAEAEFHFRSAGALTTLVFMLIGIPLGIYSRHGNLLMAFVISFGLVLIVYYPLIMIGEMLATDGYLIPWVAQWSPNMIVGAAGLVLLTWGVRR
jgi:lipopolysaccharide export LptBFGC system permease protein LptF